MWRRRWITTRSGETLGAWERGVEDAPVALVLPGLLGELEPLRDLCDDLAKDHRLLCLSHRGLYGAPPPSDGRYDLSSWHQAVDELVEYVGRDDLLWVGWSAGGRVAVEAAERHAARSRAVICLSGTFGRPFDQRLQTLIQPGSSLFRMMTEFQATLRPGARAPSWLPEVIRSTFAGTVLTMFGVTAETVSASQINELVATTLNNDLHALVGMWRGVSRHCAERWQREVPLPSLWFIGERDVLTPVNAARSAAAGPNAELMVVPGASHLLPLDQPELVRLKVRRFLRRIQGA